MKAALYEGKEKISIVDIPKPTINAGEVLIDVKYAGICGSDLEAYKTGLYPVPVVMGHEVSGTIAEIGTGVKKWKINDRVSIISGIPCGVCPSCQIGYTNVCDDEFNAIGIYKNGGFTEYMAVPANSLVPIPGSIPDKYSTLFDQIGTGLFAIREAKFIMGNTAVVIGLGTIGQLIMQCLKLSGARKLIVVEKNPYRLEVAKKFNPDVAIKKISLPKIRRVTNRIGADFVFECTGVPAVINASVNLIRKGGCLVQVGICDTPFKINFLPFITKHSRIQCIIGFLRKDFEHAVELIAKKLVNPEPIVTKIIPLDDIVEEGFERAIQPDTKDIKILVEP